jgi:hypothetical protein
MFTRSENIITERKNGGKRKTENGKTRKIILAWIATKTNLTFGPK